MGEEAQQNTSNSNAYKILNGIQCTTHIYTPLDTNLHLVSCRTWRRSSLPPQPEQDLLETREVGRVSTGAGDSLALRVLQLDGVADTLPCGTLRQSRRHVRKEFLLSFPVCMWSGC